MSNAKQIGLDIIGAVVGYVVSGFQPVGALYGFEIASVAGTLLFPNKTFGPRAQDLNNTTATIGVPVVKTYGTMVSPGTVIWLGQVTEVQSSGGSSGPASAAITYSYFQSTAIGICEAIPGGLLQRVWENGKLMYDIRPQQTVAAAGGTNNLGGWNAFLNSPHLNSGQGTKGDYYQVTVGGTTNLDGTSLWTQGEYLVYSGTAWTFVESVTDYQARVAANTLYGQTFTIHDGSETQLPDSTIEAYEGVGNVSAYRGLMYIVYPNRQLQANQALRLPNFKFEVSSVPGTQSIIQPTFLTTYTGLSLDGTIMALSPDGSKYYIFTNEFGGGDEAILGFYTGSNQQFAYLDLTGLVATDGTTTRAYVPGLGGTGIVCQADGTVMFSHFLTGGNWMGIWQFDEQLNELANFSYLDNVPTGVDYDIYYAAYGIRNHPTMIPGDYTKIPTVLFNSLVTTSRPVLISGVNVLGTFSTGGSSQTLFAAVPNINGTASFITLSYVPASVAGPITFGQIDFDSTGDPPNYEQTLGVGSLLPTDIDPSWTKFLSIQTLMVDQADNNLIMWIQGDVGPVQFVKINPYGTASLVYKFASVFPPPSKNSQQQIVVNSRVITPGPSNQSVRIFDTQAGVETTLNIASAFTAAGISGAHFDTGAWAYNGTVNMMTVYLTGVVGPCVIFFDNLDPNAGVSLDTIAADICTQLGMTSGQYDVTQLAAVTVHGYARTRPMTGKDALAPLRMIGLFDIIESGTLLRFVVRGASTVATIAQGDLGAYEDGKSAIPDITTAKTQGVDLPRQIRLKYLAPTRDYQQSEAQSPMRIEGSTVNDQDVDLVAAMDDTQAIQCAEIAWADTWNSRWSHQIVLDQSYLRLEPSDCILVPVDGRVYRMRIVSIEDTIPYLRSLSMVRDFTDSYVSFAEASTANTDPGGTLLIYNATRMVLLDIPALLSSDNDGGIYAAVAPMGPGNTWNGATVSRAPSTTSAYGIVGTTIGATTMGVLAVALPVGDTSVMDNANTLHVSLYNGTLASDTFANVLNGSNMAAIGHDGRWEIINFMTATQIGPTSWLLTGLLRGQRGTEYNVGSSQIGDFFVMLNTATMIRIPMPTTAIGVQNFYEAATVNASTVTGPVPFIGNGVCLIPFSPTDIEEALSGSDIVITWIRRSRLGLEMPSGADIPLNEATELYSIDIYNGSTIVRTMSSTVQTVTYTAAMQTADFGSTQTRVKAAIYQISEVVGRGTGLDNTGTFYPKVT